MINDDASEKIRTFLEHNGQFFGINYCVFSWCVISQWKHLHVIYIVGIKCFFVNILPASIVQRDSHNTTDEPALKFNSQLARCHIQRWQRFIERNVYTLWQTLFKIFNAVNDSFIMVFLYFNQQKKLQITWSEYQAVSSKPSNMNVFPCCFTSLLSTELTLNCVCERKVSIIDFAVE